MPLLIDIGELSESQTDRALNTIYKAVHNHDDDASIWAEHESPFIRRMIELFTQRGLMRLDGFRKELLKWLAGDMHQAGGERIERPVDAMERWTGKELGVVKLYLETLPPGEFTLDDWMMVVDYLAQRYLPQSDLRSEAEWLAVRSTFMGRVQANMENLSAKQADILLEALPATVQQAAEQFTLTPLQHIILDYARVRGCENVTKLADNTRHRMRDVVAQHTEQQFLGAPGPKHSLETTIADEFATLNRDWRRIAVTEAGENANMGMVASTPAGSFLKRVEQYKGACSWCKSIDGKVMEVVPPDAENKNGDTQIWVGKTNVGRSAAPRKRVGQLLVHREPDELYWIAAGTQHPHCRGRWVPTVQDRPNATEEEKDFRAWMRAQIAERDAKARGE
jgi:hypothetical protein